MSEVDGVSCPVSVSRDEYERMQSEEAVCLASYERPDGTRFGVLRGMGSYQEMVDLAETVDLTVLLNGMKALGKEAKLVSDLLGPDGA